MKGRKKKRSKFESNATKVFLDDAFIVNDISTKNNIFGQRSKYSQPELNDSNSISQTILHPPEKSSGRPVTQNSSSNEYLKEIKPLLKSLEEFEIERKEIIRKRTNSRIIAMKSFNMKRKEEILKQKWIDQVASEKKKKNLLQNRHMGRMYMAQQIERRLEELSEKPESKKLLEANSLKRLIEFEIAAQERLQQIRISGKLRDEKVLDGVELAEYYETSNFKTDPLLNERNTISKLIGYDEYYN